MDGFDSLTMKAGDEVILYYGFRSVRLATIEKITPSGIVRIEDCGTTFDRYGRQRGGSSRDRLAVCTPELREEASRKWFAEQIGSLMCRAKLEKDYTSTQLEAVYRILSNPEGENEQA